MLILAVVFLDESNIVKLGDFGLSKQLAQASFANTYVGVRGFCLEGRCHVGTNVSIDAVLHVTRADARKGIRFQVGHLVVRVPHLRTVCAQAPVPRSQDACRAEYIY
jgi:hypothetical protein